VLVSSRRYPPFRNCIAHMPSHAGLYSGPRAPWAVPRIFVRNDIGGSMNLSQTGPSSWVVLVSLFGVGALFARPAAAQFSAREGFTTDGACRWSSKVSRYLYLPAVDANIDLNHLPEFDICVNQARPTVSHLLAKAQGRGGFTYNEVSASAEYTRSAFGRASLASDFVQPWIGIRASYYPSPNWRLGLDLAATGLSVDSGVIRWNGPAGAPYLIAKWFDVAAGYAAVEAER
jgi:hypothetical protein